MATVDQRTVRQQHMSDGLTHEIRTSQVQRESWIRTPRGWLLWRVDQERDTQILMDGNPM